MIYPGFVDHLVFRVAEIGRTERFYTMLLGEPAHQNEFSVMYVTGETRLFFTAMMEPVNGVYEKEKVGLNHLAWGVRSLSELETIRSQLDAAGISHSGIGVDQYGKSEFLWLDDPDGMRVEFYLRPR